MRWKAYFASLTLAALATMPAKAQTQDQTVELRPTTMKRVGQVDERYQSYNVEMLEVTGGRFWKPYKDIPAAPANTGQAAIAAGNGGAPAGMSPDLYQYRPRSTSPTGDCAPWRAH